MPRASRIPAEEWERHKPTIIRLFREGTLKEMQEKMRTEHGFEASESQYEAKLHQWNIRKYMKRRDWEAFFDEGEEAAQGSGSQLVRPTTEARVKRAKRWAHGCNPEVPRLLATASPASTAIDATYPQAEAQVAQSSLGFITALNAAEMIPTDASGTMEVQEEYGVETTTFADAIRLGEPHLIQMFENAGALKHMVTYKGRKYPGKRYCYPYYRSALRAAVDAGNVQYVKKLIAIGNSSRTPIRPPESAIDAAIGKGFTIIARLMIEAGVESGCLDSAVERQNFDLVADLLDSSIGYGGSKLLQRLIECDEDAIWPILDDIFQACSFSTKHGDWKNLYNLAMATDHFRTFRFIIERCVKRSSVEMETDLTILESCLEVAVQEGHIDMVDYLLDLRADPFGEGVMKAASIANRPDMIHRLLTRPRNPQRARKCIGARVIQWVLADQPGNGEALGALLKTGLANLDSLEMLRDGVKWSPLGLAVKGLYDDFGPNIGAVDALLQAGADPDYPAFMQDRPPDAAYSPLMLAAKIGREDIMDLLIQRGADVNKKPRLNIKLTPLQAAAKAEAWSAARFLLRRGADINVPPAARAGATALQFAAISGNCNMAVEFIKHGAKLDALPSKVDGRWPLEGAAEHGRLDMVRLLWELRSQAARVGVTVEGFGDRQCLRSMNFARKNGHRGCVQLISELSGISEDRLETDEYGAPWIAY